MIYRETWSVASALASGLGCGNPVVKHAVVEWHCIHLGMRLQTNSCSSHYHSLFFSQFQRLLFALSRSSWPPKLHPSPDRGRFFLTQLLPEFLHLHSGLFFFNIVGLLSVLACQCQLRSASTSADLTQSSFDSACGS